MIKINKYKMKQNTQMDLWESISIPSWMVQNVAHFQKEEAEIVQKQIIKRTHILEQQKQFNQNQLNMNQNLTPESSSLSYLNRKNRSVFDLKNKRQRRCENSRKYRERKRQYYKQLQLQNSELRQKVDALSFKLHELQTKINSLNQKDVSSTQSYNKIKSQCLKEIQQKLSKNVQNIEELDALGKKLSSIISLDGKQKINYLNYFMSQLLEHAINDRSFYFFDCLMNKRGVHMDPNSGTELRRVDIEVFNILKLHENRNLKAIRQIHKQILTDESRRLKQLWKKLYQVYLAILNQGFKIQRLVQPIRKSLLNYISFSDFLKLELYFEKNKYHPDIRQLRSSWFRQIQTETSLNSSYSGTNPKKKILQQY